MNRMTALVIGNGDYQEAGKLKNPANDAKDIAEKLAHGGFVVTTLVDATYKDMDKALNDFRKASKDNPDARADRIHNVTVRPIAE
jgi:uncharacterized caspase-like protein